jgi:hypothetical protein
MIAKDSHPVPATVTFNALRFWQDSYIYAITIVNSLVVLCVLCEAARTRGWKGLLRFNYFDPRNLIVAASRGGEGVADAARGAESSTSGGSIGPFNRTGHGVGHVRVLLRDDGDLALVLASAKKQVLGSECTSTFLGIER